MSQKMGYASPKDLNDGTTIRLNTENCDRSAILKTKLCIVKISVIQYNRFKDENLKAKLERQKIGYDSATSNSGNFQKWW